MMFVPTQLFWYKFLFMTELIVAEALFVFRFKRRNLFALRCAGAVVFCYLVALFFPAHTYGALYSSCMFTTFFVVVLVALKFCFREPLINILFSGMAGYTTQHIAYELYELLVTASGIGMSGFYGEEVQGLFSEPVSIVFYIGSYLLCYWISLGFFALKIRKNEDLELTNYVLLLLLAMVIMFDIVLSLFLTYHAQQNNDSIFVIAICIYNIVCCYLILIIQFEFFVRRKLEKELILSNQLRIKEKEQYTIAKENVELINEKCHDLKHQIRAIGENMVIGEAALKKISDVITIYDSNVKTGNETLDIILTEKSLLCNKKDVKLSCIVDGKRLDFMAEDDIFSLFGNLIDNAIEAVVNLEEDKRSIGIIVKMVGTFLSVNIHNYFANEVSFVDGLPVTTKRDRNFHGFGMRSVRRICDKYDGDLVIRTEGGVFNVNILFQLGGTQDEV